MHWFIILVGLFFLQSCSENLLLSEVAFTAKSYAEANEKIRNLTFIIPNSIEYSQKEEILSVIGGNFESMFFERLQRRFPEILRQQYSAKINQISRTKMMPYQLDQVPSYYGINDSLNVLMPITKMNVSNENVLILHSIRILRGTEVNKNRKIGKISIYNIPNVNPITYFVVEFDSYLFDVKNQKPMAYKKTVVPYPYQQMLFSDDVDYIIQRFAINLFRGMPVK